MQWSCPCLLASTTSCARSTCAQQQLFSISFYLSARRRTLAVSTPCSRPSRSGARLGSSPNVCVCLSAALLLQIQALAGPHPDQPETEAGEQIKRISHWAYVGELCIHGDPSGVDNTVASRGKALLYLKTSTVCPRSPRFPIGTKQQRSTATQVQKLHRLKENNPATVSLILDAIGTRTESALKLFSTNESAEFNDDSLFDVGGQTTLTFFAINYGGLKVSLRDVGSQCGRC
ncbi:mevalonate kinase [Ophiostoma piceae UAMH 11346]|uniref:Mevalonate kinase n=1 Tax=Ophiostoma piceae (strain UAMH 11346) TaxID=1262450 RepID=S3CHQ8_OPHP1|nr:mevalonate kinase [Ophiostoma piceae UAMH 11346]